MKEFIKKIIPYQVLEFRRRKIIEQGYKAWIKAGCPAPAHAMAKQKELLKYKKEYNIDVLIETGTLYGGTLHALKSNFKTLISIEISHELFILAKSRFKTFKHIKLYEGDSSVILPLILNDIKQKCLFWLDGHYSGDNTGRGDLITPIYKELEAIYRNARNHIILIDDARLFVGKDDYPTLDELKSFILNFNPKAEIKVEIDIIMIVN
jgi:hypothetical protein